MVVFFFFTNNRFSREYSNDELVAKLDSMDMVIKHQDIIIRGFKEDSEVK